MRANFIFSEVWIGLRRNLTMTIAVVITVAVGMAMLGVGLMINAQVGMMKGYWDDKVEVSVYLCSKGTAMETCKGKEITKAQTQALDTLIKGTPGVKEVFFEDQSAAYQNFQKMYANTNKALATATKVEDMPQSFRIKVADPNNYKSIVQAMQGQPGVSQVVDQAQLVGPFFEMLDKLAFYALAVAIILVLAAALLIGNTVRLSAFNRRRETGIMRLVGASNLYIQLPFVMEGVIAGLIGGVFAAVILIVTKVFLFEELGKYLGDATAQLGWNDVAQTITITMVIGVVICVLASFVTLRRYLRV
ncbi:permease-like cell division protein FtsX [Nonomuraea angiospora]|uniref:Cell division protein FtsX n=2 Tax=Nonomuraea angiospora TaxID=46172 RepID=A0ABR9MBY3_9ACTN|nr:permease-like cell division protein FtsX [Nonomuraea angiospora]MBE1590392.1 cell division transport system permease protein [Nonomuraea angiospora]MDX3109858.1 permease-like cell division protein FtsX [Nonomuraea angiospora]